MSTEIIEHSFEVESPVRLKVSNVRGHIDVQTGDNGVISVKAVKHKSGGGNGNTQIIVGQEEDGLVFAEAKYENSVTNWFGLNKPCRVDFTIRVPKACSLKVNCVSSTASINGLEGHIDVNGVSGDMELINLTGKFDFSSVSGKIIAENLVGSLNMNNVSGKVMISSSQISSLTGKTVSGNLTVETPIAEGPYEFKSVSGNMSVVTPEDTACTIRIKSVSGKAKVNLPVTSKSGTRNKQVIEVAGGGPEFIVKSVSGRLKIGCPNYVKSVDPRAEIEVTQPKAVVQPMQASQQPKSQMQILMEIEKGNISVDEALKQLNP